MKDVAAHVPLGVIGGAGLHRAEVTVDYHKGLRDFCPHLEGE